jgi:hypothetical protein
MRPSAPICRYARVPARVPIAVRLSNDLAKSLQTLKIAAAAFNSRYLLPLDLPRPKEATECHPERPGESGRQKYVPDAASRACVSEAVHGCGVGARRIEPSDYSENGVAISVGFD